MSGTRRSAYDATVASGNRLFIHFNRLITSENNYYIRRVRANAVQMQRMKSYIAPSEIIQISYTDQIKHIVITMHNTGNVYLNKC